MSNPVNILIVDDNVKMRETLSDIFSEEGYKITGVGTLDGGKKELEKKFYNITLVDLKLPDGSGLELLKEIKRINKETLSIIFTGFASLESSVCALNEGAFAYVQKPLNIDEVKIAIKNALEMQRLTFDNKNLLNRLKELSLRDAHTELYNYRYLTERLKSEIKRARRYVLPLSAIMLDIDYFKSINDVYGHQYGDIILKEFAQFLINFVRGNDIVIRYGGEEFVILLPDTNKEGAIVFGQRLVNTVEEHVFDPEDKKIKLKISIGISSFPEDRGHAETASGLLNSADKALLNAKEMGGNKLSTFDRINEDTKDIVKKDVKENIDRLKEKLSKTEERGHRTLLESVYAFARTIQAKDYYTGEHAENMVYIVIEIGKKLDLSGKAIENLKSAAMLHDLGKVGISDDILHKSEKLTKEEYETIKNHPQIGAEILRPIRMLSELVPIILYHHERFDGLGYSAGLKGQEIPLGARIVAVADVYQALVSDRPYRKAYSEKEALGIIREGAGTQFDPAIVEVFLKIMKQKKE